MTYALLALALVLAAAVILWRTWPRPEPPAPPAPDPPSAVVRVANLRVITPPPDPVGPGQYVGSLTPEQIAEANVRDRPRHTHPKD